MTAYDKVAEWQKYVGRSFSDMKMDNILEDTSEYLVRVFSNNSAISSDIRTDRINICYSHDGNIILEIRVF